MSSYEADTPPHPPQLKKGLRGIPGTIFEISAQTTAEMLQSPQNTSLNSDHKTACLHMHMFIQ